MNILLVSAGNSIHTIKWANAFVTKGHNVTVVACANHAPKENAFDKRVNFVALKFSSPLGYYLNAWQLKCLVSKIAPDIINIHYASGYATLARLSGLKRALLNVWGSDVYDFPYESHRNMKIVTKNLNYFAKLASTSHCMAVQTRKIVDRDIFVTPFGVDIDLFKPIDGLRDSHFIRLGTVKTLSAKYGIKDSILAFDNVVKALIGSGDADISDKLMFDIYGKGDQKDELQALIDRLGYHDRITLKGYIANIDVPKVINTFDVFVCLSELESFGVAAVEAMACGVAVVASDADGFKEVVAENAGIVTPKCDYVSASKAILKLIKDKKLREEYGSNGIKHVEANYSWADNVDTMLDIYKGMII